MGAVGVMVLQLLLEPFFDVQVIGKGNIKEDNEFLSNSWSKRIIFHFFTVNFRENNDIWKARMLRGACSIENNGCSGVPRDAVGGSG